MRTIPYLGLCTGAAALLFSGASMAQTFTSDVRISNATPDIEFVDITTGESDWQICVDAACNFASTPSESWAVANEEGSSAPIVIENGADQNQLYLASNGAIGLGTNTPVTALHGVVSGKSALEMRFESPTDTWDVGIQSDDDFSIQLVTGGSNLGRVINIEDGTGNVGIFDNNPEELLKLQSPDDTTALVKVQTDGDATGGNQAGFQFVNGGPSGAGQHTWDVRPGGVGNLIFNYNGSSVEFTYTTGGSLNLAGSVNPGSSRAWKKDIEPIDQQAILERVTDLPIAKWTYIRDTSQARHMGPMAEDFAKAFELGSSDSHISTLDADGVALAAIQGLKIQKDAEVEALRKENEALKAEMAKLSRVVQSLAAREQHARLD